MNALDLLKHELSQQNMTMGDHRHFVYGDSSALVVELKNRDCTMIIRSSFRDAEPVIRLMEVEFETAVLMFEVQQQLSVSKPITATLH